MEAKLVEVRRQNVGRNVQVEVTLQGLRTTCFSGVFVTILEVVG